MFALGRYEAMEKGDMRVTLLSPGTEGSCTVGRRQPALFAIGAAILLIGLPWTLHGQDPDDATLNMLNLKVIALTQQVSTLQQKVAALQQQGSRVKAPFEVVDAAGKTIAKIETVANGRAAMTVGTGTGGVTVGVGASGAGALLVRRADGKVGVELSQTDGRPMGVYVLDTAGAKPVAELAADTKGNGKLTIGDPTAGGVMLGVGVSGAGVHVVRRVDGKVGVDISQLEGRSMAVRVLDAAGAKPLAMLGVAANGGGLVSTSDPAGNLRAVMNGLQGEIHAVDAAGRSRATMTAEGAFSIRNAQGTTVVRIGEGAAGGGALQIANSGGNAMVEAGTLATGAGVVRAFPFGLPGTFIMGRQGK